MASKWAGFAEFDTGTWTAAILPANAERRPPLSEPGLDLHQWETRWSDLQEQAADAPDEALPEFVRLVEEMLTERGYALDDPVVEEGEDFDLVRNFQAARDISRAAETTPLEREDLDAALEDLQEIHDFLIEGRAPP